MQGEGIQTGVELTLAGVGNTLAGDDGVGIFMLQALRERLGPRPGLAYAEMAGDLYAVWDLLPDTASILFLDAVCGDHPGRLARGRTAPRAYSPSFHQSDVSSVMESLSRLREDPMPAWEIWGITIDPPEFLGQGLSPPVRRAAETAVEELCSLISGGRLVVDGYRVPALIGF
ncbi:MAG: hydrogenase maturation protease [Candidatus Fermentibacteraceae bacterium]